MPPVGCVPDGPVQTLAVVVGANGPDGWRAVLMAGGRTLVSLDAAQAAALGLDLIQLSNLFGANLFEGGGRDAKQG